MGWLGRGGFGCSAGDMYWVEIVGNMTALFPWCLLCVCVRCVRAAARRVDVDGSLLMLLTLGMFV